MALHRAFMAERQPLLRRLRRFLAVALGLRRELRAQ